MKLPHCEQAIVAPAKITSYLLSEPHPVGRAKARFFRAIGFDETNSNTLIQALLTIANTQEVVETISSIHGTKYVISGYLTTPTGRNIATNSMDY